MQRHCDGTDPNLTAADGSPCACGLEFDDRDYELAYPHLVLSPFPLTDEQREAWYAFLGVTASG